MSAVEALLDESVAAKAYIIRAAGLGTEERHIDLSKIDFDALAAKFRTGHQRIETERLSGSVLTQLVTMVRLNPTRIDYMERFQLLIDEYNAGSLNVEEFFKQLVAFAQSLNAEEQRGISEQLTEEELAVFDLLTKPEIELTAAERAQVKTLAHDLLTTLKRERLVLDWRKRQQTRAGVLLCIEQTLDRLPSVYSRDMYGEKCNVVYHHVFESYFGEGRSVYAA